MKEKKYYYVSLSQVAYHIWNVLVEAASAEEADAIVHRLNSQGDARLSIPANTDWEFGDDFEWEVDENDWEEELSDIPAAFTVIRAEEEKNG